MDSTINAYVRPMHPPKSSLTWCAECVVLHDKILRLMGFGVESAVHHPSQADSGTEVETSINLFRHTLDARKDASDAMDTISPRTATSQTSAPAVEKTSTESAPDLEHKTHSTAGELAVPQHSQLLDLPFETRLSLLRLKSATAYVRVHRAASSVTSCGNVLVGGRFEEDGRQYRLCLRG